MLALQKQNYRDNKALDGMIDVDMSITWALSWLTLPQRNVNCFEAPFHSATADRAYVVCVAWDRLGKRDNHDNHFASPVYLPCITTCTLPTPPLPSLCSAVDDRSRRQFIWLSCGWRRLLIISHWVSRTKKISPDTDTTQYMQISPNSQ